MWWTILEWATPGNIIYKSIGASASVSVAGVIDEAMCLTRRSVFSGKEVVCRCCDRFHSIAELEALRPVQTQPRAETPTVSPCSTNLLSYSNLNLAYHQPSDPNNCSKPMVPSAVLGTWRRGCIRHDHGGDRAFLPVVKYLYDSIHGQRWSGGRRRPCPGVGKNRPW